MFKIKCLLVLLVSFATHGVFAQDYIISQKNKTFLFENKKVQAITVKKGDIIHFKNEDSLFHNIFSMSKIMPFNLGPFEKGESKEVTFNKVGTVKVECAIHPRMEFRI